MSFLISGLFVALRSLDGLHILSLLPPMRATHLRCSRSHQTYPLLLPPTPPSFPLDFAQLLQATAATPASRPRPARPRTAGTNKNRSQIPEEDEWDLLDDDEAGAAEFP